MADTTPNTPTDAETTQPDTALSERLIQQGLALHLAGQLASAEQCYQQALTADQNQAKALLFLGILRNDQGRHDDAKQLLQQSLALTPDQAVAYQNIGRAQAALRQYNKAIESYLTALSLPQCPIEVYNDLGSAYRKLGKFADSEQCYHKLLAVEPNNAKAYNNLGNTLRDSGQLNTAIQCFKAALQRQPDYSNAIFNWAFTALLAGDYSAGWQYYQQRLNNTYYTDIVDQPDKLWQNDPPPGRRLLIIAEQGLGDTLQFIRFIPLVRSFYSDIIFMVQADLMSLLQLSGVANTIIAKQDRNDYHLNFDAYIHLMSLPYVLGITLENLPPPIELGQRDSTFSASTFPAFSAIQSQAQNRLKVGMVWAGNPNFTNDFNRSCSLTDFIPLLKLEQVLFFSLQKGEAASQLNALSDQFTVINLMSDANSFTETATMIASLDLVITVDTVIAHLAGNLGIPAWVLLPYAPDWRWLRDRTDSPWYPSIRLYRQQSPRIWTEPVQRLVEDLRHLMRSAS